jgi:tight adherence protein C
LTEFESIVIESVFGRYTSFSDWMALSGILVMIAGGATLVVASIPTRGDALIQRINFAVPRAAAKLAAAEAQGTDPLTVLQGLPLISGGLSDADHRQVIGVFSHFGVSADRSARYFVVARLVLATALCLVTLVMGLHFAFTAAHWWLPVFAAMGAAIGGWILPIFIIAHLVKKRMKAIASGLPNALDLLVVCVEAGLSLEDGLQRVARELQDSQPALAEELALTWAEASILPDRIQALVNLSNRIDSPGVRTVVGMLSQSLRFGTPLGQSLRVGATEMRNDQMTKLEERASRLPALMTIPVMLFIMPTIFLIVGGPAALTLMDVFSGPH